MHAGMRLILAKRAQEMTSMTPFTSLLEKVKKLKQLLGK
jgi:hypothetical protein